MHEHVIAVHKNDGLSFDEFTDDPNIGLFAIQYNRATPEELNAGVASAWKAARGRYSLVMSEAANYGFGIEAQRKNWACALGGASVMALGWTFDKEDEPSSADLNACGRLVRLMEAANVTTMAPHNELAFAGTTFVLADPGHSYIAYAYGGHKSAGLKGVPAGAYALTWLDLATGATVAQQVSVNPKGDQTWTVPEQVKGNAVVWVRLTQEQRAGGGKNN